MGCGASAVPAAAGIPAGIPEGLSYDKAPLSHGGHKDVFAGVHKGKKVAVVIARPGGEKTIIDEINAFNQIGRHPHIIEMVCCGRDAKRMPIAALEAVEPIGYDMSRLVNQYSWTGQVVPEALMGKLLRQLISAVQHMHSKGLVHQDLKLQNVLVTVELNVKLIDMGIVRKISEKGNLRSSYLAPEVNECAILSPKVDCWGVGLILHQAYQFDAQLLNIKGEVHMRKGVPSDAFPMSAGIRETMCGLLEFDPKERWSLEKTLESTWLKKSAASSEGLSLNINDCATDAPRRFLRKYVAGDAMTAYAVKVTSEASNMVGKSLGELNFQSMFGVTVLLVAHDDITFERCPGKDTKLTAGTWIYFGIQTAEVEAKAQALTNLCEKFHVKDFKQQAHDTSEAGRLVAFMLEFDCFTFPDRKGGEYVLGPTAEAGQVALDLRNTMNLNVAGVVSKTKGTIWYPSASTTAQAGDLGLVVRAPQLNGKSMPTVEDQDLEAFMQVKDEVAPELS